MSRLAHVPLRFLPGTAYNYSLSLDVLGEFMPATGRSLRDIVRETVTAPFGMVDTDFAIADESRLVAHYGVDAAGHRCAWARPISVPPPSARPAWSEPLVRRRLLSFRRWRHGGNGRGPRPLPRSPPHRRRADPLRAKRAAMTTNALPPTIPQALEPGWTYGLGTETLSDPTKAEAPSRRAASRARAATAIAGTSRRTKDHGCRLHQFRTGRRPGPFVEAVRDALFAA